MKRLVLAAVVCVAAAGPVLAETSERTVDALKIFALLDKFYAVPAKDRSLIAIRYMLRQDGKPATDVKLTLVDGARRSPIPLGADGQMERVPTPDELARHVQVAVEAPKGAKLGSGLTLDTAIKPAAEIDPGQCVVAIAQANAAIAKAAGVMAFAAPKVKAVSFLGAGSGTWTGADGKATPLPMLHGAPVFNPAQSPGARTIRLATTPRLVSLE